MNTDKANQVTDMKKINPNVHNTRFVIIVLAVVVATLGVVLQAFAAHCYATTRTVQYEVTSDCSAWPTNISQCWARIYDPVIVLCSASVNDTDYQSCIPETRACPYSVGFGMCDSTTTCNISIIMPGVGTNYVEVKKDLIRCPSS